MNFLKKLKETCIAVLPISAVVILLALTITPLEGALLVKFLFGTVWIILGLTIFLTGCDIGIMPAGAFLGAALTVRRNLPLLLASGLLIGVLITIAEPSLLILGQQAEKTTGNVSAMTLVYWVSAGVGLFLVLGLARTVFQIPFRLIIIAGYAVVFLFASRISPVFVALAFDSGGATTGQMTVPFIIALGVGIFSVRSDRSAEDDSFGLIGIASIGPMLAVVLLGLVSGTAGAEPPVGEGVPLVAANEQTRSLLAEYAVLAPEILKTVALALTPLAVILGLYQIFLLRLPPRQLTRISIGFGYTCIGLIIFLLGTNSAFIPVGKEVGFLLGQLDYNRILIPLGFVLGALVVCAEPAIWVLTESVEEVSGGNIRRPVLLTALALGVAASVGLSMWRVLDGFSIWYILAPWYAAAIALSFACPRLFTAIAFDSGGVASGPLSSTFVLALLIGASEAVGGNPGTDAFGLIAMIAVTPIVTIQILGWLYALYAKKGGHA
ncbi:MAG TPA: DUF1538 domain-containing protein [Treponemataceae bacterium]|nr:DUF1538 domain-containing protein [Treponemataceae bacterium]HOS35163.1 DUF1538 domain-containing protein [Treponemataceae bacterium]HOU38069.1 DUF1538 domain-containing protein [Treponemataceae bacterium]HPL91352.1 DUF1538 domain-containing protein [Treponemataceae bacterium]HQF73386.1 DUF1538 domain-containing protein [Treponemataceae bacterium]